MHHGIDGFVGTIDEQSHFIIEMMPGTEESNIVVRNCKNFKLNTDLILNQLLKLFS